MKIIICGSISAADEIIRVKEILKKAGHEVEIPEGVKRPELSYTSEILAMQPIILNGNLDKFK